MRIVPRVLSLVDRVSAPRIASAHCDLPCGVYDPAQARIEAESVKACQEKYQGSDDPVFRERAVQIKEERADLVKRVAVVADDGIVVLGDDPERSTDSRVFGPVPRKALIGVAVYRYAPFARATGLRRGPVRCIEWPPTGSMPSSPTTTSPG